MVRPVGFVAALDATPEQLRALVATAAAGSFTGAARALRKSQSAVSQNIAALEAALGLRLFDRSGYRPVLTAEGRRVHELALRVVGEVEALAALARSLARGHEMVLSVGIDEFFPMDVAARALTEARARFPETRLAVRTGALGEVAELVMRGEAQLGVCGPLEREPEGLARAPLMEVGLVPVAARHHPLARRRGVLSRSVLRAHLQIVLTDRSPYTQGALRGGVDSDYWLTGSLATKRVLLLEGLGWGTMPRHLIAADLRRGRLVRIRPEGWVGGDFPVALDLVHARASPLGPAGTWLSERLTQLARGTGGSRVERTR
jgi:DNA-binding transcriptional LysR family regulator